MTNTEEHIHSLLKKSFNVISTHKDTEWYNEEYGRYQTIFEARDINIQTPPLVPVWETLNLSDVSLSEYNLNFDTSQSFSNINSNFPHISSMNGVHFSDTIGKLPGAYLDTSGSVMLFVRVKLDRLNHSGIDPSANVYTKYLTDTSVNSLLSNSFQFNYNTQFDVSSSPSSTISVFKPYSYTLEYAPSNNPSSFTVLTNDIGNWSFDFKSGIITFSNDPVVDSSNVDLASGDLYFTFVKYVGARGLDKLIEVRENFDKNTSPPGYDNQIIIDTDNNGIFLFKPGSDGGWTPVGGDIITVTNLENQMSDLDASMAFVNGSINALNNNTSGISYNGAETTTTIANNVSLSSGLNVDGSANITSNLNVGGNLTIGASSINVENELNAKQDIVTAGAGLYFDGTRLNAEVTQSDLSTIVQSGVNAGLGLYFDANNKLNAEVSQAELNAKQAEITPGDGLFFTGFDGTTLNAEVTQLALDTGLNTKQDIVTAGTGLSFDGTTLNSEVTTTLLNNGLNTKQNNITPGSGLSFNGATLNAEVTTTVLNNGLNTKQNNITAGAGLAFSGSTLNAEVTQSVLNTGLNTKQNNFTAGTGLSFSGSTLNAEVTQSELDGKLNTGGRDHVGQQLSSISNALFFIGYNDSDSHSGVVLGSITGNTPYISSSYSKNGTKRPLRLMTSGTVRIHISETTGNVGIGKTTVSNNHKLDVNGQIKANSSTIATSDDRIKYNEQSIGSSDALEAITQLRVKKYDKIIETPDNEDEGPGTWIPTDEEWAAGASANFNNIVEIGFIAQEVKNIPLFEKSVEGDEVDTSGNQTVLGLNYNDLFCVSIAAIQEINNQCNVEKDKVSALESELALEKEKTTRLEGEVSTLASQLSELMARVSSLEQSA